MSSSVMAMVASGAAAQPVVQLSEEMQRRVAAVVRGKTERAKQASTAVFKSAAKKPIDGATLTAVVLKMEERQYSTKLLVKVLRIVSTPREHFRVDEHGLWMTVRTPRPKDFNPDLSKVDAGEFCLACDALLNVDVPTADGRALAMGKMVCLSGVYAKCPLTKHEQSELDAAKPKDADDAAAKLSEIRERILEVREQMRAAAAAEGKEPEFDKTTWKAGIYLEASGARVLVGQELDDAQRAIAQEREARPVTRAEIEQADASNKYAGAYISIIVVPAFDETLTVRLARGAVAVAEYKTALDLEPGDAHPYRTSDNRECMRDPALRLNQWTSDGDDVTFEIVGVKTTLWAEHVAPFRVANVDAWSKLAPFVLPPLTYCVSGRIDANESAVLAENTGGLYKKDTDGFAFMVVFRPDFVVFDAREQYAKCLLPVTREFVHQSFPGDFAANKASWADNYEARIDDAQRTVYCLSEYEGNVNALVNGTCADAKNRVEFRAMVNAELGDELLAYAHERDPQESVDLLKCASAAERKLLDDDHLARLHPVAFPKERIVYLFMLVWREEPAAPKRAAIEMSEVPAAAAAAADEPMNGGGLPKPPPVPARPAKRAASASSAASSSTVEHDGNSTQSPVLGGMSDVE